MAPLEHPPRDKARKKALIAERALAALAAWQNEAGQARSGQANGSGHGDAAMAR
jgi:hypothetical protein